MPIRLWTYYSEFSIWTLVAMAVTSLYLWLSSRPRYLPAHLALFAGLFNFQGARRRRNPAGAEPGSLPYLDGF